MMYLELVIVTMILVSTFNGLRKKFTVIYKENVFLTL